MITSVDEFIQLNYAANRADRYRGRYEPVSEQVWVSLIQYYPDVHESVVLNKTVPAEILHRLAASPDVRVRTLVAMKRKLLPETFELLAADPDPAVRGMLLDNPKLPSSILTVLTRDRDHWLANKAMARISSVERGRS